MRSIVLALLSLPLASLAHAASLTLESDKATYQIGETITLTLVGDPMAESAKSIFARVVYDAGLTETVSSSQTPQLTSFGENTWDQNPLFVADGSADLLNQICCLSTSPTVGGTVSTATLVAEAAGVVDVVFDLDPPFGYFSVTEPEGTSFTIVPEPGAAALIALGLAGLVAGARRRG